MNHFIPKMTPAMGVLVLQWVIVTNARLKPRKDKCYGYEKKQ